MELAELKLAAKSMSLAKSMEVVEIKYFKVKIEKAQKGKVEAEVDYPIGRFSGRDNKDIRKT